MYNFLVVEQVDNTLTFLVLTLGLKSYYQSFSTIGIQWFFCYDRVEHKTLKIQT